MEKSVKHSKGVQESSSEARPGRSPKRSGPARRDAILAAALRLFREQGFHGTSINDIGAAAGVTGPALYRHFTGKSEVLSEAIREGSRRIAAATRAALTEQDQPAEEALASLVRAYVAVALENADMHAAYVLETRHLDGELRAPLRRGEGRLREAWERRLLEVRPALSREQAKTLVNMAIFAVVSLCIVHSKLDRDSLVEFASGHIMSLLLASAPANA